MECKEQNLELYDVINADEAFLTGTPFAMLPITSINKIQIANGKRGQIYDKLLSQWSEHVGVDIETQIKSFNKETQEKSGVSPYRFKK